MTNPFDPRARSPRAQGLGEIPGEAYGQAPGLIGAPTREDYLREHPPGYPQMPQPAPLPNLPEGHLRTMALTQLAIVRAVLEDRFLMDRLATTLLSWAKQAWRPVHLQPWITPPFRAQGIGGASVNAGVTVPNTSTFTTIVSDVVPVGYMGVIAWLGQDVAAAADWAALTWRIAHGTSLTNLAPYRGFAAIQHQLGQIEAPCHVEALIVGEGETVALQASSASNVTGVQGRIHGWMWPRTGGVADGAAGSIVA